MEALLNSGASLRIRREATISQRPHALESYLDIEGNVDEYDQDDGDDLLDELE